MRRRANYCCLKLRDRKVTVRLEEPWYASSSSIPLFAGNKKWKLQHWIQRDDYPVGSFLVSHGGYQSNAMLALAQLARMKRMGFVYYTKSLPSSPEPASGNLKHALELGMQVVSLSTAEYDRLFASNEEQPHAAQERRRATLGAEKGAIFVPQGAACPQAEEGIREVALDINTYAQERMGSSSAESAKPLLVVLPSGTGTTGYYLAQHLSRDVDIACVPCLGRSDYLRSQMEGLSGAAHDRMPRILEPPPGRYSFARPSSTMLQTWKELQQAAACAENPFEFDLIYAPRTWQTLFHHWEALAPYDLLYVHTGGLEGTASQLQRYASLNPAADKESGADVETINA